jgi:mono/diheme cytochrome c family protein
MRRTEATRRGRGVAVIAALGVLSVAAACAQTGDADAPTSLTQVQQGRAVAQRACASCHTIRELGDSPRQDKPPLREALDRYSASRLELALRQGLIVGHADMPVFELSQAEVEALLAYLQDIRR